MSGHSKWANIKHKKAREDAKRGKVFTKLIREITVSARDGGGDPAANARLRLLVEKARYANMPQDNITRAIKKGIGEIEGVSYKAAHYEGYGPSGIAVIVEALTDNKNRTVADVRHLFSKMGGTMAESGAVSWMFEKKGMIVAKKPADFNEDEVLEKLFDFAIDDVTFEAETISIICAMTDLMTVKTGVEQAGFVIESADIAWVPKDYMSLKSDADQEKAYKFLTALDELDDVQDVYTNLG